MNYLTCPYCNSARVRRSNYGMTESIGRRLARILAGQRWYRCRDCEDVFTAERKGKIAG